MYKKFETILIEEAGPHVMILRFNRPERANAMNTQMGLDLRQIFMDLYVDTEDIRCLVVTGVGEKIFSAGGDLKDRNGMTDQQWKAQHAIFEQMVRYMKDCPVPIIGAVNGAAYGGGCEFALGCDFLYASENARFALTEITLGLIPGAGGTMNLPQAVGERRAREIIYTGSPFSAQEAYDWGLVNKVCDPDHLMLEVLMCAETIANNAPLSVRQAKKSISVSTQVDRNIGYMYELESYNQMIGTNDRKEGVAAFNEKRKAKFTGT
jgi:enoyl-CoA hydratase